MALWRHAGYGRPVAELYIYIYIYMYNGIYIYIYIYIYNGIHLSHIYSNIGFLKILVIIYFNHGSPHLKLALILSPVNSKLVYIFDTSPYESMMSEILQVTQEDLLQQSSG